MKQTKDLGKSILYFCLFSLIFLALIGCGQRQINIDLSNIDSFYNLQEHIIQNDFNVEKERDVNNVSFNASGEYDLNKDGKMDSIEIDLAKRKDSSLRINELEISIDSETPSNVYLVDLIKDDDFVELAIYDDGPSGDPKTTFYRYDGKGIHELGTFETDINVEDSVYEYYGNVLTDGKGNFIPPSCIVKFTSPNIIKGYYSIEDDKFKYHAVDYRKDFAADYSVAMDFEAFFIEHDLGPGFNKQRIEFIWDPEKTVKFKKDEKMKIITIDEFWYGIELQDGTTGILYFWIGD